MEKTAAQIADIVLMKLAYQEDERQGRGGVGVGGAALMAGGLGAGAYMGGRAGSNYAQNAHFNRMADSPKFRQDMATFSKDPLKHVGAARNPNNTVTQKVRPAAAAAPSTMPTRKGRASGANRAAARSARTSARSSGTTGVTAPTRAVKPSMAAQGNARIGKAGLKAKAGLLRGKRWGRGLGALAGLGAGAATYFATRD